MRCACRALAWLHGASAARRLHRAGAWRPTPAAAHRRPRLLQRRHPRQPSVRRSTWIDWTHCSNRATSAFKAGRLLTPIDNCAYDYYREALEGCAGSSGRAARARANRRTLRCDGRAGRRKRPVRHSAQDGSIRPGSSTPNLDSIASARDADQMRSTAQRHHTSLDADAAVARSSALSGELKTLGAKAKAQRRLGSHPRAQRCRGTLDLPADGRRHRATAEFAPN